MRPVPLAIVSLALGSASLAAGLGAGFLNRSLGTWEVRGGGTGPAAAVAVALGVTLLIVFLLLVVFRRPVGSRLEAWQRTLDSDPRPIGPVALHVLLFVVSAASLYIELMMIRWMATEFRFFAYFKNFGLISAFLGLGLGFALARRRRRRLSTFGLWLAGIIAFVVLGTGTRALAHLSYPGGAVEQLWASGEGLLYRYVLFYATLVMVFLASMMLFVPLGQETGRLMLRTRPLLAYAVNLAGSLTGIWLYTGLAAVGSSPAVWVTVGVLMLAWLYRASPPLLTLHLTAGVLAVGLLVVPTGPGTITWSPYYRINIQPMNAQGGYADPGNSGAEYVLDVNHDYHQRMLDLGDRPAGSEIGPGFRQQARRHYDLPHEMFPDAHRVLVVGAGTGNDVAAALRWGAEHVDAVEIDPEILQLGMELHPEHPYDSPKVQRILNDARNMFHDAEGPYDLVVFGLLDSHTLASSMSTLRLDNYVYTVESFREVAGLLSPDGAIALSFAAFPWVADRIALMLEEALGTPPLRFQSGYDFGVLFLAGPGVHPEALPAGFAADEHQPDHTLALATDDWPFLYLKERSIPTPYWVTILLVLAASTLVIVRAYPEARRLDLHFFCLGAAFLLIEVRGVTALALLFGSTWIVNSLVITGILVMALVANGIAASRFSIPRPWTYLLLLGSIGLDLIVPDEALLGLGPGLRAVLGTAMISLPVFFAGLLFSSSLKRTTRLETAFASNLLGAMCGGFLEYLSLAAGLQMLLLVAAGLYVLSAAALKFERAAAADSTAVRAGAAGTAPSA